MYVCMYIYICGSGDVGYRPLHASGDVLYTFCISSLSCNCSPLTCTCICICTYIDIGIHICIVDFQLLGLIVRYLQFTATLSWAKSWWLPKPK